LDVFALRADAPWWELWRLWTCHLVHYDWRHLALNAIAALPPFGVRWRKPPLWFWAVTPAFISLGILLIARPYEYRGASALIMSLWFMVPGRIGKVMIVLATVKLLVETFHPLTPAALPLAHWLGAAAGVIGASILRRCSPSSSSSGL
jgi:hypothetical protein